MAHKLKVLTSKMIDLCYVSLSRRGYRTKHGVYGYSPQYVSNFVNEETDSIIDTMKNPILHKLATTYQLHGHKMGKIDPLELHNNEKPVEITSIIDKLDPATTLDSTGLIGASADKSSLNEVIDYLESTYCGTITCEFHHVKTSEERNWFAYNFEKHIHSELTAAEKIKSAKVMLHSQAFDHFMTAKYSTVKRYGGEGAESAMCFYDELFKLAALEDIEDVVCCIAHRGRLNLLTCLLQLPPELIFRKIKKLSEFPEGVAAAGDVISHLTSSIDLNYGEKKVHVTMLPNPSHLEAVNPVAMGKCRARQQSKQIGQYSENIENSESGKKVLCLQIHGDAAFAGQGIVAETLALSELPHFNVDGSVHLIINNQIGYTTPANLSRSSLYNSCIAKMNGNPVIHVNGDSPEDVVKACRLAFDYRQKFGRDVFVDLLCFRKYGHNEVDDPTFTQPEMYRAVRNRKSIPDKYAEILINDGICSQEKFDESVNKINNHFSSSVANLGSYVPPVHHLKKQWSGLVQATSSLSKWNTGISIDLLKYIGAKSVTVPNDVAIHPQLKKTHVDRRLQKLEEGDKIDWGTAEALAIGSLLYQGFNVRICGQDVGRGTFSQRHWMLVDQNTDEFYVPLNYIHKDQTGNLEICNSLLSEEAVLAFEYGMSIENPKILVIWEAQFGDFFNTAQVIFDTFISGGESKWLQHSGIVIILPHGMDGTGPEHSSCKIERFLQMTDSKENGIDGDDVNMYFVNPTTPESYFHLLRRQMVRNFRKPLIIAGPKILLRHSGAVSDLNKLVENTFFKPVLPDDSANKKDVTRLIFVSGKHYYTLEKERDAQSRSNVAIIRLEELCPFPSEALQEELRKYPNATEYYWSQEEHRNQGPWSFVNPRFENIVGVKLKYTGRDVLATPATGIGSIHEIENQKIIKDTFS